MPRADLAVTDLLPGDLIVWKMGDGDANHVEIYTGASHFAATSIHAVNTPAKDMTRVMPNSFTPGVHKHVFRCQNANQTAKAIKFASNWARFENRYDKPRIDVKTAFRDMHRNMHTPAPVVAGIHKTYFHQRGRFRAIKYAARRASILCYPGDDGNSGHGMTCCMFAILCFQVAGIASQVDKLAQGDLTTRISDKKMGPQDLDVLQKMMTLQRFSPQVFSDYQAYVRGINEANEYNINWAVSGKAEIQKGPSAAKKVGMNYYPSIMMWRNPAFFATFNWADAITPGMMLDAKIAQPGDVWASLQANPADWTYEGSMAPSAGAAPTEAAKAAYQAQLQQNRDAATANRAPFARN